MVDPLNLMIMKVCCKILTFAFHGIIFFFTGIRRVALWSQANSVSVNLVETSGKSTRDQETISDRVNSSENIYCCNIINIFNIIPHLFKLYFHL